ncbi:hypothetical protein TrVE_jg9088 [Triparma verrucosa]|uniref:Ankyrin n=1 Tax=Triparma verrucosa TaxID=1606542 RepID=A0A9W7BZN2_9STRA|nr:hypothetical protein TrVE_jg9088 [Triparma verrucosa]
MPFGRTPLHVACRSPGSVSHLLPSNDLNTLDSHDFTPIYHAANMGNEVAVSELLKQEGVDVNLKDKGGMTPFHVACYSRNSGVGIVEMLLEKDEGLKDKKDSIGRTGMDWAREKGRDEIVKYLTERVPLAKPEYTTVVTMRRVEPVEQVMVTEVRMCGRPIDAQCPECGISVGKRPGGLHHDYYKCDKCSFVEVTEEIEVAKVD